MPEIISDHDDTAGGLYSKNSIVQFDRPADTDAYGAGDVISDAASQGVGNAIQFKGVGKSGRIDHALVVMEEADTVNLELWVFGSEPTGHADNDAIALVAGDNAKLLGIYSFADAAKFSGGASTKVYTPALSAEGTNSHRYTTADGTLWGLLVTRSVYTPISASQFVVVLQVEADHA